MKVVELSHVLSPDTVMWPGCPQPEFTPGVTVAQDGFYARSISMWEHSGTHVDAPAHFVDGGQTVEDIAAERLVCPAVVLDVRQQAAADRDYAVQVADVEAWESRHGPVPAGAAVLMLSGWADRVDDAAAYAGAEADGTLHFPGFGADAARLLVERGVYGLGTDTLGIDSGCCGFPVHADVSLPRGLWHLENLANLDRLPPAGATVFVGAIRVSQGSGAPARVIAVVD